METDLHNELNEDHNFFGKRNYGHCFLNILFFFCLFAFTIVNAQTKNFSVFLVGDAGEDAHTGPTLLNLKKQIDSTPNSVTIFLGDNSYKDDLGGLIHHGFKGFDSGELTQQKVRSQLDILKDYKGYVFFIPGNHDWWNKTKYLVGKEKLKMEESFIEQNLSSNTSIANPNLTFLPKDGLPGPEFVDFDNKRIRIIFIDTYRMIIEKFKKEDREETPVEKTFYQRLDSLIKDSKNRGQQVIVAGHHTIFAKGPNSGSLSSPNLFARIKASNRNFPSYQRMVIRIRNILKQYPGIYYCCGHVHALLYYYPADSVHYIVSGAGSKTNYVSQKDVDKMKPDNSSEYMLWNNRGFFKIEFSESGEHIFLFYDDGEKKCEIE